MIPIQIAIDGPVAAGKGDIAARLAKELHLAYIYTGAMYRMLALACIEQGKSAKDKEFVISLLDIVDIDLSEPEPDSGYAYRAMLDGRDVSDRIVQQDVAMGASDLSIFPEVRVFMVRKQQELAIGKRVVMEGRDIGLRVLPEAQLKIYLTASVNERALRRWKQFQSKGIDKSLEEVIEDTKRRDEQDMKRATDPLQKLDDAWELDTTGLSQEEVVGRIKDELIRRGLL